MDNPTYIPGFKVIKLVGDTPVAMRMERGELYDIPCVLVYIIDKTTGNTVYTEATSTPDQDDLYYAQRAADNAVWGSFTFTRGGPRIVNRYVTVKPAKSQGYYSNGARLSASNPITGPAPPRPSAGDDAELRVSEAAPPALFPRESE